MAASNQPTPAELARDTLRLLLQRKISPTPEAYAKCYRELSGEEEVEQKHPLEIVMESLIGSLQHKTSTLKFSQELNGYFQKKDWSALRDSMKGALGVDPNPDVSWPDLMRDLLYQWEFKHEQLTQARKREMIDHVLKTFGSDPFKLYPRLKSLTKSWADQGGGVMEEVATNASGASSTSTGAALAVESQAQLQPLMSQIQSWQQLCHDILVMSTSSQLGYSETTVEEAKRLAERVMAVQSLEQMAELQQLVHPFWFQLSQRGETLEQMIKGLLILLQLLTQNFQDLNPTESRWVGGQVEMVNQLIEQPITPHTIRAAEKSFRDFLHQQSSIRNHLHQMQEAIKEMVAAFVVQLSEMTHSTGTYSSKFDDYATQIQNANNLPDLQQVLANLLNDTRALQADVSKSHQELVMAQERADIYQQEIIQLQDQLDEISTLVREDALTNALNRRGLEQAFAAEQARCERKGAFSCIALLDIDNFKKLNDAHGHRVGDEALVHLSQVIRDVIRPSDALARYGGEEFVIILPETELEEAQKIMVRLQRELTKRFFLNKNEKLFITFSAGVAKVKPQEKMDEVLIRADAAMYEAKRSGKNRVHLAQ